MRWVVFASSALAVLAVPVTLSRHPAAEAAASRYRNGTGLVLFRHVQKTAGTYLCAVARAGGAAVAKVGDNCALPAVLLRKPGSTDYIDLRDKTSVKSRKDRCVRWW